jgi:hypothetical protein
LTVVGSGANGASWLLGIFEVDWTLHSSLAMVKASSLVGKLCSGVVRTIVRLAEFLEVINYHLSINLFNELELGREPSGSRAEIFTNFN